MSRSVSASSVSSRCTCASLFLLCARERRRGRSCAAAPPRPLHLASSPRSSLTLLLLSPYSIFNLGTSPLQRLCGPSGSTCRSRAPHPSRRLPRPLRRSLTLSSLLHTQRYPRRSKHPSGASSVRPFRPVSSDSAVVADEPTLPLHPPPPSSVSRYPTEFPGHLQIDYVRVYQRKSDKNVGCDPKDYRELSRRRNPRLALQPPAHLPGTTACSRTLADLLPTSCSHRRLHQQPHGAVHQVRRARLPPLRRSSLLTSVCLQPQPHDVQAGDGRHQLHGAAQPPQRDGLQLSGRVCYPGSRGSALPLSSSRTHRSLLPFPLPPAPYRHSAYPDDPDAQRF